MTPAGLLAALHVVGANATPALEVILPSSITCAFAPSSFHVLPDADAVLCGGVLRSVVHTALRFADPVRGQDVTIRGDPGFTIRSRVREVVLVDRHVYRAGPRLVTVRDVLVILLDNPAPPGASGALVRDIDTGRVIGTVHGNASINGGNAVCLDPKTLRELYEELSRSPSPVF